MCWCLVAMDESTCCHGCLTLSYKNEPKWIDEERGRWWEDEDDQEETKRFKMWIERLASSNVTLFFVVACLLAFCLAFCLLPLLDHIFWSQRCFSYSTQDDDEGNCKRLIAFHLYMTCDIVQHLPGKQILLTIKG